jgi:energy-coupling factor transporter ATP-binding protein EcfA2
MPVEMTLTRFRVTNFRSVDDSGWIEVDDVTALIGTNESGKTNLLLPLWKLNPAKNGEVQPTSDYPRKHFTSFRNAVPKPIFIEADFSLHGTLRATIASMASVDDKNIGNVTIKRRLDGKYEVLFRDGDNIPTFSVDRLVSLLSSARSEIDSLEHSGADQDVASRIIHSISLAESVLRESGRASSGCVSEVCDILAGIDVEGVGAASDIVSRYQRLKEEVIDYQPAAEIEQLILDHLPKFVYYSNYGNLDSEIYLPHVIQNLRREEGLGQKEQSKARTLKVLFEFVDLKPDEVLELGRDITPQGHQPTEAQIEQTAQKKKERSILLQSASTRLTDEFRRWWKQGTYRFRFDVDGDHFRIWVADDRRPEEVELEGRSTGLQWFLSFYLVFLVESKDAHSGSILLLDEPGHSLHPLAQRDLSDFFAGLAEHNQLLYTTHSPFLVDADRLDRARKVFVAPDGTSKATPDLGADGGDPANRGAGYAVHAALGLSMAEGLLIGCEPVVVEGPSDQHYLTAIKTILVGNGLHKPGRDLVFPPAGGAKGVKAVASILGGRGKVMPLALLDSDAQGKRFARDLQQELYAECPSRVLQVGDFIEIEGAEVEDVIPPSIVVTAVDRMIRAADSAFGDRHDPQRAVVPQIEAWARDVGVSLEKGWKVELAKRVKRALLDGATVPEASLETWSRLFDRFQQR